MNPYREPSKPSSRLKQFFVNRVTRITPLTVVLAAVLVAGVSLAATQALRVNGIMFGAKDLNSVYLAAYGCKCDGATDDTTCITNAVAAANAAAGNGQGGVVMVPSGTCVAASPLVLSSLATRLQHVKIKGVHGPAIGAPYGASTILYTGTGATSFMQLNYARDVTLEDVAVLYSSSTFTGTLVDFSASTINQNSGGTGNAVKNCTFGSSDQVVGHGVFNAANLVSYSNTYAGSITGSHFSFGKIGIMFGATASDFANSHEVDNNRFDNLITAGIANASQKVTITNNTFEPGTLGGVTMYPAYLDNRGATNTQGLEFINNWVGDGDGSTAIFDTSANPVYALDLRDNYLTGGSVKLGNMIGGKVVSNYLTNAIVFKAGGTYVGSVIEANAFHGIAATFTNQPTTISFLGNDRDTDTVNTGDQATIDTLYPTGAAGTGTIGSSSRYYGTIVGLAIQSANFDSIFSTVTFGGNSSNVVLAGGSSTLKTAVPIGQSAAVSTVSSATTISSPAGATLFKISGTTAIATINLPWSGFVGKLCAIPTGLFTTTTAGNISLASTAVVNKTLCWDYDGTKWNPSY